MTAVDWITCIGAGLVLTCALELLSILHDRRVMARRAREARRRAEIQHGPEAWS